MSNHLNHQSVIDFLNLRDRIWILELKKIDFRTTIAKILELPQEIYDSRTNVFFWTFINQFLQKCEIGFILWSSQPTRIELALLGYWQNKQYAIPLWTIKDQLLGFKLISREYFATLDSKSLKWSPFAKSKDYSHIEKITFVIKEGDPLNGEKIYFKIENARIDVYEHTDELNLFNRIALTDLLDQDDLNED